MIMIFYFVFSPDKKYWEGLAVRVFEQAESSSMYTVRLDKIERIIRNSRNIITNQIQRILLISNSNTQ